MWHLHTVLENAGNRDIFVLNSLYYTDVSLFLSPSVSAGCVKVSTLQSSMEMDTHKACAPDSHAHITTPA